MKKNNDDIKGIMPDMWGRGDCRDFPFGPDEEDPFEFEDKPSDFELAVVRKIARLEEERILEMKRIFGVDQILDELKEIKKVLKQIKNNRRM